MRIPAKVVFSARYHEYGICGALGLLDQGFSEESGSDMAWSQITGGETSVEGEPRDRYEAQSPRSLMGGGE